MIEEKINDKKNEVYGMEITKKKNKNNKSLDIVSHSGRRYSFESVGSFKYLAVNITSNGEKRWKYWKG